MRCPICKKNTKQDDRSRHGVYAYEELEMVGYLIDVVRHMEKIERRIQDVYKCQPFGRREDGFADGLSEALSIMNFNWIYTKIWRLLKKLRRRKGNDRMRAHITDCFEGWKVEPMLGKKRNRQ